MPHRKISVFCADEDEAKKRECPQMALNGPQSALKGAGRVETPLGQQNCLHELLRDFEEMENRGGEGGQLTIFLPEDYIVDFSISQ